MKKITLCVFILSATLAQARPTAPKKAVNPVIAEARDKIQNRDRVAATSVLIAALKNEKLSPLRHAEFIEELHKLAALFFSDEGQRAFEFANAMRFSGQPGFLPQYVDALKADPMNWIVLLYQALAQLQLKNCKAALDTLTKAEAIDPFRVEAKYLLARTRQCLNEESQKSVLEELTLGKDLLIYKLVTLAQLAVVEKNYLEVERHAKQAISLDKNFPMGYYWAWVAQKEEIEPRTEEAQKYVILCKGVTAAIRRIYYLEPDLCTDVDTVENFLKKMEQKGE